MREINRLTPRMVEEAFYQLDLRPLYGVWVAYGMTGKPYGAHALAALVEKRAGFWVMGCSEKPGPWSQLVASRLHLEEAYVLGFWHGWNARPQPICPLFWDTEELEVGYQDGLACHIKSFGIKAVEELIGADPGPDEWEEGALTSRKGVIRFPIQVDE